MPVVFFATKLGFTRKDERDSNSVSQVWN